MLRFPKKEKLCGQITVKNLFAEGSKFVVWPLRVTYLRSETDFPQVLVWASKNLFKHAVDRNLLRRRMREAYRLNKQPIENSGLKVAFNYMDKSLQPYVVIDKAMKKAVKKLSEL